MGRVEFFRDSEFREVVELALFFQLVVFCFYGIFDVLSIPLAFFAGGLLYVVRHRELLRNRHVRKFFVFLKDRKPEKHMEKYVNGLVVLYSVFLIVLVVVRRIFLLPEQLMFLGLVGAFYLGKGRKFLMDWVPFIVLIIGYEAMRGFANSLGGAVHYTELISADRTLFGVVPTEYLQAMFYVPGRVMWYDVLATIVYILHFSAPLILAYFFWCEGRNRLFKHISSTIIITSYVGLIIFLVFPAAPPWLAYEHGQPVVVHKVIKNVTDVWKVDILWTVYQAINPNEVAAMPSLHAAYPWIVYLYVLRRWKTHIAIVFPLVMALSLVYMGEHYVVDVLAGFLLATLVYLFVDRVFARSGESTE